MNEAKTTTNRKKKAPAKEVAKPKEIIEEITVVKGSSVIVPEIESNIPKNIDTNQYITVRNGHHGVLVYTSNRTGENYRWDDYGDEQEMQLRELRDAKNSSKKMFLNNWFLFDKEDDWVIDYLGVRNYYKNAIGYGEFDAIFQKSPDELKAMIAEMSEGQKNAVCHRAKQLIFDGEIDSRKCIAALEEALNVELSD